MEITRSNSRVELHCWSKT